MKKIIFPLCILCSTSVYAQNKESHFYIGATAGQASYDVVPSDLGLPNASVDDEDNAFKIFGGYNVNDYFSIEAGYANLGELNAAITYSADDGDGYSIYYENDNNIETDGYFVNVKASYPITESFEVYGKAGMLSWESKLHQTLITEEETITGVESNKYKESHTDDGNDFFYGVGVSYKWQKIDFRAEYEIFDIDGNDVDIISVGATYSF